MKNLRLFSEIAFVAIALSATAWIFWKRVIPLSQSSQAQTSQVRNLASQPTSAQSQ